MKKNLPLYSFIALMIIFTIGYFLASYKISYAFPTGEETDSYDLKIKLIEKAAESYAENTEGLFAEEASVYVTVDELIEKGFLFADNENGDFKDPRSEVKTLNDVKVRITNQNDKIETKVLS